MNNEFWIQQFKNDLEACKITINSIDDKLQRDYENSKINQAIYDPSLSLVAQRSFLEGKISLLKSYLELFGISGFIENKKIDY